MIPKEILKKIRHIELKTRGMVNTAFSGQYRSVFKGRGMNFEEVREYQPGDEVHQSDLGCVPRTVKHAFPEIRTAKRHTVEAADKVVAIPDLDAVAMTSGM